MVTAVLDRFEENKAVLLLGISETKIVIPRSCLPPGLREGDHLQLTCIYDEAATKAARAEAEALLQAIKAQNA